MKIRVGYADDGITGATIKYRIIDQTISGRYLVMRYNKLTREDGTSFLASYEIEIKDGLDDISEEDWGELDKILNSDYTNKEEV